MSRMFVWGALLVTFVGGCGRTPELTSVEPDRSADDSTSASAIVSAPQEPTKEAAPPTDVPSTKDPKRPVVDVEQFLDAALDGNLEVVQDAIDAGLDVNAADEQARNALMLAAFNGHTPLAKLLLDKGAMINHRDAAGRTALMFAASGPNAETVKYLLDAGAEVNAADTGERFTALMHAAAEGQVQVVKILLEHNADPAIRDVDGDTARDFAARNGHTEVAQLLTK